MSDYTFTLPTHVWQPIETAPKDGTRVLVYGGNGLVLVARWMEGHQQWWSDDDGEYGVGDLTHWLPLPEPPRG